MSTFDPDLLLRQFIEEGKKLCFYPSCGMDLLWSVMQLNASVFIFSDYYPKTPDGRRSFWRHVKNNFRVNGKSLHLLRSTVRTRIFRSGDKWGFLFFQDNNEVLTRIQNAGGRISYFVGINDGCSEGGNYQCVHEEPFLGRLLELSTDPLVYFTDHSSILGRSYQNFSSDRSRFRPQVVHRDQWVFQLHSLLEISRPSSCDSGSSRRISRQDVEVVFHGYGMRTALHRIESLAMASDEHEIVKLADFRTGHATGTIARYDVTRLPMI